ncbi:hypothetical protein BDU57DRAFT_128516 [Ampelomyces quisqualis]|uniref:Uncharacterized protein n=1 Tax=Ampelomyces quisqualis TaxID=50730 RepID=A0A6A5QWS6_AMPQU|nr:hypothetical protein BDU57DRAFT_128516 [Ampelomyces quisqualis]
MDSIAIASQTRRADTRHRRWAQTKRPDKRQTHQLNKNNGRPNGPQDTPSSAPQKEQETRPPAMTSDHRLYHRRQAGAATEVLVVSVEVVATVDTSRNPGGQQTKTHGESAAPTVGVAAVDLPIPGVVPGVIPGVVPGFVPGLVPSAVDNVDSVAAPVVSAIKNPADALTPPAVPPPAVPVPAGPSLPQVPTVPAAPTVALPVVPAVPPFPTDLTVPAYPFATAASVVVAQISSNVAPSPAPTSVPSNSAVSASPSAAVDSISKSSSVGSSALPSASSRSFSSDSDETASSRTPSATSYQSPDTTTYNNGPGGVVPANTADPAQNTAAVGSGKSGPTTPLQMPQVVGSVVGSLAGAALILAIVLLLLKRHKRQRRGVLQLTNDETSERAAPMSQDPSRNNRISAAFLNRFSGMSKSTTETNTSSGERSFQRVSGRKLPSAFSEGMTSDQFSRGGTVSGSSFYHDDQGTYGGPALSKEFGKEIVGSPAAAGAAAMNIRPGPGRTPVIRHADDHYANPFADPPPSPSLQSADNSRSSKFTENV